MQPPGESTEFTLSQRERMLRGLPYNPRDAELLALARAARATVARLTATPHEATIERAALLQELFGQVGDSVWIETPFFCEYGKHVTVASKSSRGLAVRMRGP